MTSKLNSILAEAYKDSPLHEVVKGLIGSGNKQEQTHYLEQVMFDHVGIVSSYLDTIRTTGAFTSKRNEYRKKNIDLAFFDVARELMRLYCDGGSEKFEKLSVKRQLFNEAIEAAIKITQKEQETITLEARVLQGDEVDAAGNLVLKPAY